MPFGNAIKNETSFLIGGKYDLYVRYDLRRIDYGNRVYDHQA